MANRIYGTKSGLKNLFLRALGKKRVLYASNEVTNRCACKCKTCPIWEMKKVYEPDFDTEKLIIDRFKEAGVVIAVFTGGEPLLREDTPQILKYSYDAGLITCLVTNGCLLSERIEEFYRYVDRVVVSLDSHTAKVHDHIRGVKIFDKTVRGIKAAKKLGAHVVINCVISKFNLNHLEEVLFFGEKLGVSGVSFDPMQTSFFGKSFEGLKFDEKEQETFKDKIRMLINLKKSGHLVINTMSYLKFLVEPEKFDERCDIYGVKVDWRGRLFPTRCDKFFNKRYSIEENSINEILDKEEVREASKKLGLCRKCSISCIWEPALTLGSLNGFYEMWKDVIKNNYWRLNTNDTRKE